MVRCLYSNQSAPPYGTKVKLVNYPALSNGDEITSSTHAPAVGGGEGGEWVMVEHGVVGGVPLLQAGGGHAGQVAHAAVVRPASNKKHSNLKNMRHITIIKRCLQRTNRKLCEQAKCR
jgi:hypothetical protein